jgi:hypothetical protein
MNKPLSHRGLMLQNFLGQQFMNDCNKLDCFTLADYYSLV